MGGQMSDAILTTFDESKQEMITTPAPAAPAPAPAAAATPPAEPPPVPAPAPPPPPAAAPASEDDVASEAGKTLAGQRNKLQERINQLTHDKYANQRELIAAREQIAAMQARLDAMDRQVPQQQEAPPAPAPTRAKPLAADVGTKYQTYEDFVEDLADWKAEQKVAAARAESEHVRQSEESRQREAAERAAEAQAQDQFLARATEFAKEHPDYQETVLAASDLNAPPMMRTHILRSDMGPALVYHLAKNREDFNKIVKMAAGPMLVALGKLEARLEKEATPTPAAAAGLPVPPKPAPITSAPPPIVPVSPSAVTNGIVPDASGANFRQWADERNAELAKRGRRW